MKGVVVKNKAGESLVYLSSSLVDFIFVYTSLFDFTVRDNVNDYHKLYHSVNYESWGMFKRKRLMERDKISDEESRMEYRDR